MPEKRGVLGSPFTRKAGWFVELGFGVNRHAEGLCDRLSVSRSFD